MVEGPTLVAEALQHGAVVEGVYLEIGAEQAAEMAELALVAAQKSVPVYRVAEGVLDGITDTVTPRPVLAVVALPDSSADTVIDRARRAGTPVLVLVDVRDPGNVGTIIRAADASGAAGVLCCVGTADPFSPKVVRSAAGSVLHLPVVVGLETDEVFAAIMAAGIPVVATVVEGGTAYDTASLSGAHALVLGNEAAGLDRGVLERVDQAVTIPMHGQAESLNVAMASAVLCFEAARQRRSIAATDATSTATDESDWTPLPTDDKVNTP